MRPFVIGTLLVVVHTLSATLFQYLKIGNVAPNFMIMLIVSFALLRGSKEGSVIGIAAGLLHDLSFGMSIGPTAIIYGLIGYVCGTFNKNFYRENFILPFVCTLFSSLFYSLTCIFSLMLRGKLNIIFFMKSIAIPEMIYTITLSLIAYQITYLINEKLEMSERKTRNIF
nr:rod shape-determining protein MreD [uncultured Cellulosilyticum sp.]